MRVLLLNPPSRDTFRRAGILLPPLGLLYVAAAARARRHLVRVADLAVERRRPDFSSSDVVGIYCDTSRYPWARELARLAKGAGARVVMGGPHPWFCAEEILSSGHVDAIVKGEGEKVFPDLLDCWENGGDPGSIPGLIFPAPGGPQDTAPPERIHDLDSLPFPARDLVDLSLYAPSRLGTRPLMSLHTSRGCPYGCRFCSSTSFDGPKWRARSSENILSELEYLVKDLGYRAVAFLDDNFLGSPERIHQLCEGILQKNLDVHWWCFCRADTAVRNPHLIQHMAEAGARNVFVGVESPSPAQLKRFHKGIGPEQVREAVEIFRKNRIEVLAAYILGAPEESRRDLLATIRFARKLNTQTAQFTLLTPYPGTALYEQLKERITERDWSKFDAVHAVFDHPRIPRLELQFWLIWANLSFYLRSWKSIRGLIRYFHHRLKRIKRESSCNQPSPGSLNG
ncbi:MAG: B12-binding domain-containing radical SAM protein [Deltaproteobacteria bacterium]|nr:B12-binding domain-containing radical SAM protein [Deltaproteobacteria bacterium]MBW2016910.1 B12-binding domain-containing radical SAM protein [Deltaproteobacteria bacterium]